MDFFKKAVSTRRKNVAEKFISEAIILEKENKYKPAGIHFERASMMIDDTEEQALALYSSFCCYKLANDHTKADCIISASASKYRLIGENEAADICEFERGKLQDDTKLTLRFKKGVQSALRGCWTDINPSAINDNGCQKKWSLVL